MPDPLAAPIITTPAAPVATKPIDPGMINRVVNGWRELVSSVKPEDWMSPGQPVKPQEPETKGRMWDFPPYYNTRIMPRADEAVGFEQLRALADAHYLTRLAIETRKDQMVKLKGGVKPIDEKPTSEQTSRAQRVNVSMRFPDREHDFETWLRMLLEDKLVIDATCIEPRKTKGGEPYSLDLVDGATIKRILDNKGRTPAPPDPAYQQIIRGVPANNLTTDELIYAVSNPRTNRVYGYSPVEQIIFIVNIALRREIHKLQFYTEGTIPEGLAQVPDNWSSTQIKEFQAWWDSVIEGNTGTRRKMRFMPSVKDIIFPKEAALKDAYDEWLARIVCYAFSLSPNALIAAMTKTTGETVQQAALEEGLSPLQTWVKNVLDLCIQKYWGHPDLEWAWQDDAAIAPLVAAQVDDINIKNGSAGIDEVRKARGQDPLGVPPLIVTSGGVVTIEAIKAGQFTPTAPAPAPEPGDDPAPGDDPLDEKGPNGEAVKLAKARKKKLLKAPANVLAREHANSLSGRIESFFRSESVRIATEIAGKVPDAAFLTAKADDPDLFVPDDAARIVNAIDFGGWSVLVEPVEGTLMSVGTGQDQRALAQVGMADDALAVIKANDAVVAYARARAAELVGMRRLSDGRLVVNPRASMAITESTRERLKSLVVQAVSDGLTREQLTQAIMESGSFSAVRAEAIAHTEVALANLNATVEGWKASGVVTQKVWLLSNDHKNPDECDENADAGPVDLEAPFPGGVINPPQHVNCLCDVAAVVDVKA